MSAKKEKKVSPSRTKKSNSKSTHNVLHGDARELSMQLKSQSVDVTITSPPYFDLKDYGSKNQIGFGQEYDAYLADLQTVFREILRATKDTGSLWVVIDTFRKEQEVLPLPFDLTAKLKEIGWSLRDVIIWKKERTLPWVHKGTTRKIFEYILVFSKPSKDFRYYPDVNSRGKLTHFSRPILTHP